MSKFKVFLAGVSYNKKDNWIVEQDYPVLLSQLNDWGSIKKFVEDRQQGKLHNSFFIDSGAFTALTKGVEIKVSDYVDKIDQIGDNITMFANLDVIPDMSYLKSGIITHFELTAAKDCVERGWDNFMYIQQHSKYADKCLFVYHRNDGIQYLNKAIEWYLQHPNMQYIGLGGMANGIGNSFKWCVDTCNYIKKRLPNIKIHLFGYTKMGELQYINADSTDSTVWIMNSIYGLLITPFGKLFVSDRQTSRGNAFDCWSKEEQQKIIKWVTDFGFDFETLRKDQNERLKYNAKYMQYWADHYEYKPYKMVSKKTLL